VTLFDSLFSDGSLTKYIKEKQNDIWKNTYFEGYEVMFILTLDKKGLLVKCS